MARNMEKKNAYGREYRRKQRLTVEGRNKTDAVSEVARLKMRSTPEGLARSKAMGNARARKHKFKHLYGITVEQYELMAANQGWCCAICGIVEHAEKWGKLHVDHDHETGQVRELLCQQCNSGLGQFGDSPERLELAAEYLRRNS